MTRSVDVLLHERLVTPVTCGVLRPAVLLPLDAARWPEADIHRALAHELEHVRRGDWMIHLVARATCAIYWFHPFVWTAWRHLCLEAERTCDDAVLQRSEGTAYAEQLVRLARHCRHGSKPPALAMAGHSDIVKLLLERGANIDQVVQEDENGLIQASARGHLTVVQLLVDRGADVHARVWVEWTYPNGTGEWRTALSQARKGRHAAVVAYLQSVGAQ